MSVRTQLPTDDSLLLCLPYPTALTRPALAPSESSCLKRMVPPWEPPVFEILSYVPEECHANLSIHVHSREEARERTRRPVFFVGVHAG